MGKTKKNDGQPKTAFLTHFGVQFSGHFHYIIKKNAICAKMWATNWSDANCLYIFGQSRWAPWSCTEVNWSVIVEAVQGQKVQT